MHFGFCCRYYWPCSPWKVNFGKGNFWCPGNWTQHNFVCDNLVAVKNLFCLYVINLCNKCYSFSFFSTGQLFSVTPGWVWFSAVNFFWLIWSWLFNSSCSVFCPTNVECFWSAFWLLFNSWNMQLTPLPYLRGGQALTPAQRWGCISLAHCASPNITTRLQVAAIKP